MISCLWDWQNGKEALSACSCWKNMREVFEIPAWVVTVLTCAEPWDKHTLGTTAPGWGWDTEICSYLCAADNLCHHRNPFSPTCLGNSSQCTVCKDLLAVGQTTTLQHWILSQELQETGTASFKLRTKYLHFIPYCWHYQPLLTCHFMCFHGEEESKPT